jgi:hypothetical protein
MKVSELIEILQQYDPELRVLVDGYECDFDTPVIPGIVRVEHNPKHHYWEGEWRESSGGEPAVIVGRG